VNTRTSRSPTTTMRSPQCAFGDRWEPHFLQCIQGTSSLPVYDRQGSRRWRTALQQYPQGWLPWPHPLRMYFILRRYSLDSGACLELMQATISSTTKIDSAVVGLSNAGTYNICMQLLLQAMAIALVQMNAIQRLRRILMTRCLPCEIRIILSASNFMPADRWNIDPDSDSSSYTIRRQRPTA
jgi:hypothetical protein